MSSSSSDAEDDLEKGQSRIMAKSAKKDGIAGGGTSAGGGGPKSPTETVAEPQTQEQKQHRRFKIKRATLEHRRQQHQQSKIHPTIDECHAVEQGEKECSPKSTLSLPKGGVSMDRRFSRGGTSLEFPPNIDFYRNTLEKEESGDTVGRPSMMDLVEGSKHTQQGRRESRNTVERFREHNAEILEGQQRALGIKLTWRNTPRRTDSESSKKSLHVVRKRTARPSGGGGADESGAVPDAKVTKFGWVEGVLIRCMASIFGVMLYLRLSWVSGQAGILLGSCIVMLGTLITVITTLSTSAICTNGLVKGGGAYFLISRSLGPEFGGSIGIIFSIANAVGAAMYLVGFAETIRDLLKHHGVILLDGDINDIRIIALVACAVLVVIILVGLSFESKMQIVMMVVLWMSIFDYWIGTFLPPNEAQQRKGMTGYKMETLKENLMPQFRDDYNFFTVFAVYFPAATGIMAGANISGDLRDPQTAIPLGTLVAIVITSFVYLLMVWMTGSTVVRDSDGLTIPQLLLQGVNSTKEVLFEQISSQAVQLVSSNGSELDSNTTAPMVQQVDTLSSSPLYYAPPICVYNQTCPYGLMNYFQIVEQGAAWGPLVTVGIIASTLSSALVSMVGAPKIFQAVCRDRLFPYINRFGRGHGPNNDPRQALFLAAAIAVAVILIGNLNLIAPLISNFFLCSYALINYACFDNSFAHSPGFRPSFKYYNMWVSLAGSLMCVFCMFIISWWTALLTFFFFVTIYMYVAHRKPDVNWGSSAQAHSYRNALQYVSKLERTEEHVKNYRPQLLVLTGNPAARAGIVDFAYSITKGSSLLMCGYVIPYRACNTVFTMMQRFNQQLRDWFVARHMKAFAVTVANPNLRAGVQALLQISGLGKLRPNIILMGYKSNWNQANPRTGEGMDEMHDYFGLIQDAFDLNMSVGVLRNSNKGLDISELILETSEQLCRQQHLEQEAMTTGGGRRGSYPTEAHPHQKQSTHTHNTQQQQPQPLAPLRSPSPRSANARQRARDLLLRAFGQRDRTAGGLTVQSTLGTVAGGDTVQTTVGQGGTINTHDGTMTQQQQRRRGLKGWLNRDDTVSKSNNEADHLQLQQPLPLPLPSDALRFQTRVRHGTIDVWWLYDDGGLTLLIPYLLTQQKSYLENAKLRVFTLAGHGKNLQQEHQGLVTMLKKFRITADQVNVIPDFTNKKPDPKSLAKFEALIEPFMNPNSDRKASTVTIPLEDGVEDEGGGREVEGLVTDAELKVQQERTWRHLRIAELLRRYSSDSDLIVVTLPVPRRGLISAPLYLAWLELMSAELPPTLMLRGNQQSVLTFYS